MILWITVRIRRRWVGLQIGTFVSVSVDWPIKRSRLYANWANRGEPA